VNGLRQALRIVVAGVLASLPVGAHAQTVDPPLRHLQIAAGGGFLGGVSLGTASADLRSGGTATPYPLFDTSTRLESAPVFELRASVDLTRRYGVEAHALFGHPELRTRVSDDVEGAPGITAVERLDHYLLDGGVVIQLPELALGGVQPFATAGAGYLRQLHEGLALTEEGHLYYVGAGVRRVLVTRPRGLVRGVGVRGDVRVNVLFAGISVTDDTRRQVAAGASLFVIF
jgi:hypothetical protein